MKKLLYLSTLAVFFIACNQKGEAIEGSGKIITNTITLKEYKSIVNNSAASIELDTNLAENQMVVTGDENFVKNLDILNNEETLNIDNKKNISINRGTNLIIKVNNSQLKKISISGVGSFDCKSAILKNDVDFNISGAGNINANVFNKKTNISVSGAGSVTLVGNSETISAKLAGVGNLNSESLENQSATIAISGAGNAKINTKNNININISGIGNLEYKNYPNLTLVKEVSGIGSINTY